MPVFETPKPISVTVDISAGYVQLIASDRTDTVVEVRPADASDQSDVEAAAATRVDYTDGELTVRGPKRTFDFSKKSKSVDVVVELPAGSRAHVDVSAGGIRGTGLLGECRAKTSMGQIRLDRTGPLRADTSAGDITIGETGGDAEIHTGTGQISVGDIGGTAVVKNSNGHIELGAVTGDLKVRAANGNITIARADANVEAKSANGNIRVGEVVRGEVSLNSSMGLLSVGIAEGTAAWLDIKTAFGRVHNELTASEGPEQSRETVKVTAHTSAGDITIRRA